MSRQSREIINRLIQEQEGSARSIENIVVTSF